MRFSHTKALFLTHSCIPGRLIVPTSRYLLVVYLYDKTASLDAMPRDGHIQYPAGTYHHGIELLFFFMNL